MGTFALLPRGWISRFKKIPGPSHLHTTYLSQYSRRCYSKKYIFPNWKSFFSNLQTAFIFFSQKKLYLEVCHFRSENIFFTNPFA